MWLRSRKLILCLRCFNFAAISFFAGSRRKTLVCRKGRRATDELGRKEKSRVERDQTYENRESKNDTHSTKGPIRGMDVYYARLDGEELLCARVGANVHRLSTSCQPRDAFGGRCDKQAGNWDPV